MIENAVYNENGQVAVLYPRVSPPHILRVGDKEYLFEVRRDICLSWIDEQDVPAVLRITRTCCGGRTATKYVLANELSVKRWLGNR